MKRVNLKLLAILVTLAVAGLVGTYALHRFQVSRNAGGLLKIARAKLEEGKTDDALMLFTRYVGYRRDDADAFAEYAGLLLNRTERPGATRAEVGRAFAILEEAVRKKPSDMALRRRLAEFQLRIGRFADAREHLRVVREAAGDDTKPPLDRDSIDLLLARSWAGSGNFDEALGTAAALVNFDQQTKTFSDEGASNAESAPEATPPDDDGKKPKQGKGERKTSTESYILLAAILDEKLDDPDTAKRVLERMVAKNGKDSQAWLALARWNRQRGDLEGASRAVAEAAALAPDDPETMLANFEVLLAEKKLDEAAGIIQAAVEAFPADERVIRGSAILAMERGDRPRATAILKDGLKKTGPQPGMLLMLAEVLLQQSKLDDVEETLERLRETVGGSSPAVGLLEARLLIARQKWLQAKQKLDRVRPLVAASPELTRQVDLYLGQCHERLGQYDEQLQANRRVLSDDPSSLAARVGAASALVASGRPDQALVEFELVAAAIPEEKIPGIPQVWSPLLQLRIAAEMNKSPSDRDWSRVDALMDLLGTSELVTDEQIAILRADLLVRKGEPKDAIALLSTAVASNRTSVPLQSSLVTLELRQNGSEAAERVVEAAPEPVRKDPAFMLVEAQVAARPSIDTASKSPTDEATSKQLREIETRALELADAADRARVLSGLASIHYAMRNRAEADRLWKAVIEIQPDDLRIRMAMLEIAKEDGNLDAAKAAAREISKLAGPTSPQGRFAEATARVLDVRLAHRGKATKDSPQPEISPQEKANLREARNLLIEAENERPGWVEIQQSFAEIDGLEGDSSSAIERLQKAVRLGPGNPAIVRQLVAMLYASNRFDEAQAVLGMLGPDGLAGFERVSAEMELRSGKVDEAVAIAERSVAADSTNAGELLWLGQLLSRSGKSERAEEVLGRAVTAASDRPETWLSLIGHQIATGKASAAERTLGRAEGALDGTEQLLVVSQANEMLGRFDAAERALQEAVENEKENVVALRALAAFDVRRGRLGPAKDVLRRILETSESDASGRAAKVWARRSLAELTAERSSYPTLQKAMAILEENAGPDGELSPEDRAIAIRILADRPEPASWRKALVMLESLAKTQPLSISQRLVVAQLRENLGQWEDCRSELVSLVASPEAPPALYAMLVERLIEHREFSSAKTWLDKLQQKSPDSPVTIALEAKLAMAEEDRPKAIAAAKKLMPSGPVPLEQVPQLRSTGKLMEDLGFPKAADKVLTEFASRSLDGIVARAEFLGRQKRPDEALDVLESAWDRLPLERLLQSAVVVARTQNPDLPQKTAERIEKWFVKARRLDPDSVVIGLLQAELQEVLGRTDEVESMYRAMLAKNSLAGVQRAIVANNLAFHLARKETAKDAIELIDAAIKELGPHPDLLDTRGVVQLELGNAADAVKDLREASLVPTPVKLLHLAIAQAALNQIDEARETLERSRRLGLSPRELPASDRRRLEQLEAEIGGGNQPVSIRDRASASSAS